MPRSNEPLVDAHGRAHTYLRLSVTDRCNLRCSYCRPRDASGGPKQGRSLSREEIARVVRLFAAMGIDKVRVTGGEPFIRPDILDIVRDTARIPGIDVLAATTNGTLLSNLADDLRDAGMTHLNVSLDTLRPERFAGIAGADTFDRVLAGIDAAQRAGFDALKLNVVVMRGANDDELVEFVEFGAERRIEVRFIEFMPFRSNGWSDRCLVTCAEMRARLSERYGLAEVVGDGGSGVAGRYSVDELGTTVGFISSLSHPFCAGCDRLRITADGALKTCLFRPPELDLAPLLEDGADDALLRAEIRRAVVTKSDARPDVAELQASPDREMLLIGG